MKNNQIETKASEQELNTIRSLFQIGHANAKPLTWFSLKSGINQRQVRNIFEELIYIGVPICNLHDGRGYFLAATVDELDAYCKFIHSYILKLLKKEYRLKKAKETLDMERMA